MDLQEESYEIGHYRIIQTIGSGQSGKVKLAVDAYTNDYVAIKIIKKEKFSSEPEKYQKLQREVALMGLLDHPHILRLIEVLESNRHLHLVIEYASNGELFDTLVHHGQLPEEKAINFFREMIYALDFLHQHGICHRDLKPENILLDDCDHIKIADFGFARWMKNDIAETSCGSPHYASPEIVRGIPYNGKAADIWSAGIILFAMIAGYLPFEDPVIRNLLSKIKKGEFEMPNFHPHIQDLISKMIVVDPAKRFTVSQIKEHPAFSIGLNAGYILPFPVPLPHFNDPVDPTKLTEKVYKTLRQVGYSSNEELNSDLLSNDHTMAKVFHHMLSHSAKLEQLPWDRAQHHKIVVCPTQLSSEISDETRIEKPAGLPDDPFHRQAPIVTFQVQESLYSMASRVDWAISEKDTIVYDQEDNIPDILMTPSEIMWMIQKLIAEFDCDWFHPDDLRIIARTVAGTFIIFDSAIQDIDMVTLFVHMNHGTPEQFKNLMTRIREELNLT